VSTARSWTDDLADLRALVAFRLAGQRSSRRRLLRWLVPGLITATVLLVGMVAGLAPDPEHADRMQLLFPVGCLTFLGLVVTSAVASGGGRELLHRDGAAAYPVSPLVDHLVTGVGHPGRGLLQGPGHCRMQLRAAEILRLCHHRNAKTYSKP